VHDHHAHGAGHPAHAPSSSFIWAAAFNLGFVLAELVFALYANSLALFADAGHNLSDVLALALAWLAASLSTRRPTPRRSFGLGRLTILATLINAAALLLAGGALAWEAVLRIATPTALPNSAVVAWVALAGIAVNGATAALFWRQRRHDLNARAAFLHLAGDAAVSLSVVGGALLVGWSGWSWIDAALCLAIVAVIVSTTWGVLREAIELALDAVPRALDRDAVAAALSGMPGVREVHDLHIWALSTRRVALTAHLVMPLPPNGDDFLQRLRQTLRHDFGIDHTTIQIERGDTSACEHCGAELAIEPIQPAGPNA
jgi:cobalt-zinc-cadmium efflux system protein